jgi:ubiquinone/menaquinone biosynthesis C-methylase UbiE
MPHHKFDPAHLERLNDPERLRMVDPAVVWEELGLQRPARVADIGAGTGLYAVRFAPLLAPGGKLWACDVAEPMVEWMRAHLPDSVRGMVIPLRVEESRVGLPDESLDLAYLISVYHELDSPELTLRDALRLLRPGGTLGIVDWRKEPMPHGPPLKIRVTAQEISSSLEGAGFVELRSSERLHYHSMVVARKPATGGR